VRVDWVGHGLSTEPADREKAERDITAAYRVLDPDAVDKLVSWVDSPMAGVIASTSVGFAFREQMKQRLLAPLEAAIAVDVPAAKQIRRDIDDIVWPAHEAVRAQVAAELATRDTDATWQRKMAEISGEAWHRVWLEIGDPGYGFMGFAKMEEESDGLFEENLKPWPDAMMGGQFSAGTMAQLDALDLLTGLDLEPFQHLQRIAQNCCWWWPYQDCVVMCDRPAAVSVDGDQVTMEFRDGWRVG
jgi:hypothetical protein